MWGAALELLFPPACVACGDRPVEGAFCADCRSVLEFMPAHVCSRCAGPLPAPLPGSRRRTCPSCRRSRPPYQRIAAVLVHGGPVADAIHRLKYRGKPEIALPLGRLVAAFFADELRRMEVVVAVPLHVSRRRERGFDQASRIAREVARLSELPFEGKALARVRATAPQVGRGRKARSRNLEGAFLATSRVAGKRVALIDDVVTTGATAAAAAGALVRAGAAQVLVLAVSRAL